MSASRFQHTSLLIDYSYWLFEWPTRFSSTLLGVALRELDVSLQEGLLHFIHLQK